MARGLSKSPTSNKLSVTFFLLLMGFAFYISCVGFHERTNFTTENTVRHYNGDEEEDNDDLRKKKRTPATKKEGVQH